MAIITVLKAFNKCCIFVKSLILPFYYKKTLITGKCMLVFLNTENPEWLLPICVLYYMLLNKRFDIGTVICPRAVIMA